MKPTSTRRLTLVSVVPALLVGACQFDPETPELRYELNHEELAKPEYGTLSDDPVAQDQLRGALEMLFGTPSHPGFLLVEDWIDDEFDPNQGGYGELGDEAWARLQTDNLRAWAPQVEAIEAGWFTDVPYTRYAPQLWEAWTEHLSYLPDDPDAPDPDDPDGLSWRGQAIALFKNFYPSLPESSELYRQQCMHCHGIEGGGDGTTAEFLTPRPRDYRPGWFKYTALKDKARPRREDLFTILENGLYTTAMPSFRRFSDAQLQGLVDYVRLLSIRGETELLLMTLYGEEESLPFEQIKENYVFVWDKWLAADEAAITYDGEVPRATPELVAHGDSLFHEADGANCIKCHGDAGRGDGDSAKEPDPETGEMVWAQDDWGNPIQPRDLTRGLYRLGRRPIDMYRRIYAGINGTPMPAHYGMLIPDGEGDRRPLDEEDIWALVHYVRSLAFEPLHAEATGPVGQDHAAGEGH